jgi:hypothetical protein
MRQTILAAAAAFVIGGIATGAVLSNAQPAPPPPPGPMGAPPMPRWGGWMHHGSDGWRHDQPIMALVYRQADRQLSTADVQKIAEAFLLWNGNHSWKVTDVAATSDGPIGFSLSTPEGSVIAKFSMDPHTGRIKRVG